MRLGFDQQLYVWVSVSSMDRENWAAKEGFCTAINTQGLWNETISFWAVAWSQNHYRHACSTKWQSKKHLWASNLLFFLDFSRNMSKLITCVRTPSPSQEINKNVQLHSTDICRCRAYISLQVTLLWFLGQTARPFNWVMRPFDLFDLNQRLSAINNENMSLSLLCGRCVFWKWRDACQGLSLIVDRWSLIVDNEEKLPLTFFFT